MESFFQDLRYGLRQLRRAPGFALVAVLSLAVGMGATTAVFSIVYATLLHPYPFRDWERLAQLAVTDKSGNLRGVAINNGQLERLRAAAPVEEVLAFDFRSMITTGGSDLPEDVAALTWTTNAIPYFGVPLSLGRGFAAGDAPAGQEPQPVLLLSYLFWQRHFGGDRNVVGQTLELTHTKYRIVGVLSPQLNWMSADVYLPIKLTGDPNVRLQTSIRLKPGVTPEAASADLQPLMESFAKETPLTFPPGFHTRVLPLSYGLQTGLGPSVRLLFGAVSLLLLIACLNVSIMLMARGTRRRYELAVRAAMGAARARVVRQLLTEALLIAVMGGALGIALAYAMQQVMLHQLANYLAQREAMIRVNWPVLGFSIAATLITVVVFGLLPAVQLSRRDLRQSMQLDSQKISGGWGKLTRNALIAGQIALSLVLLASAAISIRAFARLLHTELGYDPHNTILLGIPVHENSYVSWEARAAYFDRLQQKLAATPGVTGTTFAITAVPPVSGTATWFEILGEPTEGDQQVRAGFVSPEYFSVLNIPLLQGRIWDHAEVARGARLAIINQTMARRYFPKGDALGRQIRLPRLLPRPPDIVSPPGSAEWMQIVGISADVLNNGLRDPVQPAIYLPYTMRIQKWSSLLVRARSNPLALLPALRAQVQSVDAEQQVMNNVFSLEQQIERQDDWQREHMVALLFGVFSVITLLLAGVGLYSVVSYSVAQRTREFALRMALGAQRSDVLRNVAASIGVVIGVGVAAGIGLQLAVSRVVAQWAYAPSRDFTPLLLVIPLLALVAVLACYVPARRAMTLDPMQALRYE